MHTCILNSKYILLNLNKNAVSEQHDKKCNTHNTSMLEDVIEEVASLDAHFCNMYTGYNSST